MKKLALVLLVLSSLNAAADPSSAVTIKPLRYSCKYKSSNHKTGKIILDLKEVTSAEGISLTGAFFLTLPFVVKNHKTGAVYPQDTLFGKSSSPSEIIHVEPIGFVLGDTGLGSCRHLSCPRSTREAAFDMTMVESNQLQGINFGIYGEETKNGESSWSYEMSGKFGLNEIDVPLVEQVSVNGEDTEKVVHIKNDGPCVIM